MNQTANRTVKPVLLCILDGFGINPSSEYNGIRAAETPKLDAYFSRYPNTQLQTTGRAVGLPEGQMGNSEVGHLTIGAGSISRQYLVRIDDAIEDGSIYENSALCRAVEISREKGQPLHLIGMVSDGGVHSHLRHLVSLIELCRRMSVTPLVHMITDGRDTAPRCAGDFIDELETELASAGGTIAGVYGRYYAMDRDKRWERTEKAYRAIVEGKGRTAGNAKEAIEMAYSADESDEFISPTILPGHEPITDKSQVLMFNFRNDRPRQMTEALNDSGFDHFRRAGLKQCSVTSMTLYDSAYGIPIAFEQEKPAATLGQTVSTAGIKQFHCAETEKYAHVTFFINGGSEEPYPGEDRKLIPSPRVATYDLQPEMSASAVADAVIDAIGSGQYGLVIVNFANGDMVGHTAVQEAILEAVQTLDNQVSRVLDEAVENQFSVVLTSDHGNCEQMVDPKTGQPNTQHTTFPVPCLVIDDRQWNLTDGGGLSNLAPTILELMGLAKPDEMSAESLLNPADNS